LRSPRRDCEFSSAAIAVADDNSGAGSRRSIREKSAQFIAANAGRGRGIQ
jgi:hypothetical protein